MASGLQFQHAHGVLSERCAHSQRRLKHSRAAQIARIVPGEANFDKLADAIRADNLDAAFEHAHALKGVLGNLSLTPIYNPVCEMTERLRAREQTDYLPLLTEILEKREQLKQLCDD